MKRLCIIGASGHGKVIADIAQKMGKYEEISFWMMQSKETAWAFQS